MKTLTPDLCIIGGGSGGLSVAAGASQMGADVVLFEGSKMGGDCLNYGCVPSKALLAAGKAAHYARGHKEMGIKTAGANIDFAAVKDHVARVIKGIEPHDSPERFRKLGVNVIEDYGRFVDSKTVAGGGVMVKAKYFIVATGSSAFVPPIPGLDKTPFHTNESIFSDKTRPEHLIIIGGGPIGVEMSQAHARLGVKVTLIEGAPSIMIRDHAELVKLLKPRLVEEGVNLIEGHGVTAVSGKKGQVAVSVDGVGEVKGSHLLMAVGRIPNLERLDLDKAGVKYQRQGIITDRRLRSSKKRIFAIGDAAGRQQFTHIAGYHAGIVIQNTLFRIPAKINDSAVPWVTYTDPELAHVGMTLAAAKEKGITASEVEFSLADNDRARAELRTEGKVIGVVDKSGRIIGASILAPSAGEMIQPWILAISKKLKVGAMASYISPYPTYGEASKRAAGSYFTPKLFSKTTKRIVRFLLALP